MVTPERRRPVARILPSRPLSAAVTMLLFTFALYAIEAYDLSTGQRLDAEDGIVAGEPDHLAGIIWAPLLHGSWDHLASNTLPLLIFGFLAMAGGMAQFLSVTAVIWVISGMGVWLLAPYGSVTVGASGVIFGWLMFLLFRGFFAGSAKQILLAVVLFFFWGTVLLGVIPGQPGISWQAHLFGALAGMLCARLVARADRQRRISQEPVMPQ